MKIIVTGGRDFSDDDGINRVLNIFKPTLIVVGDCPTGVDKITRDYGNTYYIPQKIYKANWKQLGKSAGPERNRRMVDENLDAMFCLAFPGGRGTAHCSNYARSKGIPVLRYKEVIDA